MNFKFLYFSLFSLIVFLGCKDKATRTPSGYDFKVVTKGSGEEIKPDNYIFFTLEIRDEAGKVLQTMEEGPNMPIMFLPAEKNETDPPNPVLDVLAVSRVGDVVVLIMPIDSIPNPPAELEGMKFIEYEMSIKSVTDKAGYEKYMADLEEKMKEDRVVAMQKLPAIEELVKNTIKDYTSGVLKTEKTESGLKYFIVEKGEGDNAKTGQTVQVQYYGALTSGIQFDNSFTRGQAFTFPLGQGQVIKGWDEGLTFMNKGSKAFLFIPAELGYGAQDSPQIPANSELIFYVEMEDIK